MFDAYVISGFVGVAAALLVVLAISTGSLMAALLAAALPCGLLLIAHLRRW
jgi:hypothetical protein